MGEILGIGGTHYPPLAMADEHVISNFHRIINAPWADPKYKDRKNWPADMISELADDNGLAATKRYREKMWDGFSAIRKSLDDFNPDFVVIFGDDQYENFQEDIIPPFCVYGLDDNFESQPWNYAFMAKTPNWWGEPHDWMLRIHGHREGAKYLTTGLLKNGVCMPYAYKTLHQTVLARAFTHAVLYLDWPRRGFPYPVVPFHVNCYGSEVIPSRRNAMLTGKAQEGLPDPPSPSPQLCMEVGAKLARVAAESPYRIALMASSSWSHGFLSPNTGYVVPDQKNDRLLVEALKRADYETWRSRPLEEVEKAGEHEMLNWMVLVGAMAELGRKPIVHSYVETNVFQSDKCFATFPVS